MAYQTIKRDIVRGRLAPDVQITETQLAEAYGVGRTPIREALGRLIQEGLVRVFPRRGYIVAPITVEDVQDLYRFRLLLETNAARLAVDHYFDERELRRLDEFGLASYDPNDSHSIEEFLQLNTEFHLSVARASGNRRLVKALKPVLDEMERLMHVGLGFRNRTVEIAHEHKDLVDALVAHQGERAAEIMAEQIHASQRMVLAVLLKASPDNVAPLTGSPFGRDAERNL